jgi:large subunit ribosomal protein L4
MKMEVDVLNMKGKKVSTVELPEQIFAAPINVDLMHQAYVRQMANARLGTHKTKSRGEVRGGGRKPWRQKGTGRARHGTIRSPIWVGGGKVHTPRPRDYSKKMPRKMRQAALRSALSVKAAEQELVMVDELSINEPKTKLMVEALSKLVGDGSTLVLIPTNGEGYEDIQRATNNLQNVKLLRANYLNVRDLLGYDKVVVPLAALEIITDHLGQKEG